MQRLLAIHAWISIVIGLHSLANELADDLVVEALALVQAEGLDGAGRGWRIRNWKT